MAKRKMTWAWIELSGDTYAWRTPKDTYKGLEEELGVKTGDDLPDVKGTLIKSSSQINKLIPKAILTLQDSRTKELSSIVRRMDPSKIKSASTKVGANGFTFGDKRVTGLNIVDR